MNSIQAAVRKPNNWIKVLLSPKVSYFLEDLIKSDFSFM